MLTHRPPEDVIGTFLLQLLAQTEAKETDCIHGRDSNDGGCHALVQTFHTLFSEMQKMSRSQKVIQNLVEH